MLGLTNPIRGRRRARRGRQFPLTNPIQRPTLSERTEAWLNVLSHKSRFYQLIARLAANCPHLLLFQFRSTNHIKSLFSCIENARQVFTLRRPHRPLQKVLRSGRGKHTLLSRRKLKYSITRDCAAAAVSQRRRLKASCKEGRAYDFRTVAVFIASLLASRS